MKNLLGSNSVSPFHSVPSVIQTMTNQCPLAVGTAVYKARALYHTFIDREADFDDFSLCVTGSYKKEQSAIANTTTQATYFKLLPNPAATLAYVYYHLGTDEAAEATLTDLAGRKIWSSRIDGASQLLVIPVADLPNGLYVLNITNQRNVNYHEKLVVKH